MLTSGALIAGIQVSIWKQLWDYSENSQVLSKVSPDQVSSSWNAKGTLYLLPLPSGSCFELTHLVKDLILTDEEKQRKKLKRHHSRSNSEGKYANKRQNSLFVLKQSESLQGK